MRYTAFFRSMGAIGMLLASASSAQAYFGAPGAQTAVGKSRNPSGFGYLEYLPPNYVEGTAQKFPVVIFLHGIGEEGNGDSDLPKLMNCWGAPPQMIRDGMKQPAIILSPQSSGWWDSNALDQFVTYVLASYPGADPTRLYLTGLSMGGGGVWDYATAHPERLAAVVPICGASWPSDRSALWGKGVWAFHAWDDPTVNVSQTFGNIDGVTPSSVPATTGYSNATDMTMLYSASTNQQQWIPSATYADPSHDLPVRLTVYPSGGHGIWGRAYSNADMWNWLWTWSNPTAPIPPKTTSPTPASTSSPSMASAPAPAPAPRTPYLGSPVALPGTIQAENFDNGGEGVAYHDVGAYNAQAYYRPSAVGTEPASDTGGGADVGYVSAGEWLEYTVNVLADATFQLDARVATTSGSAAIQVLVDGVDKTGSWVLPNTGGWQTWTTATKTGISIPAGTHVVRLAFPSPGLNVNWLRFSLPAASSPTSPTSPTAPTPSRAPYGGVPVALPGTIEGENFDTGGEGVAYHDTDAGNVGGRYRTSEGVDIAPTWDAGGGYLVGWIQGGEWLEYTVSVVASGTFSVDARTAAIGTGFSFSLSIDGADVTGAIAVPVTGDWNTFATVSRSGIALSAGKHVVRLSTSTGGFNLNWIRFNSATAPSTSAAPTDPAAATPTATPQSISIDFGSRLSTGWNGGAGLLNGGSIALRTDAGAATAYQLAMTSGFNGVNTDGTTAAAATLAMPSNATSDSFFGNDVAFGAGVFPQATLELRGLDPTRSYSLEFFSSRMTSDGSNRETVYQASGATSASASLNVANNTSGLAKVGPIAPTSAGVIRITVKKGPNNDNPYGFFYLGNLRVRY